MINHYLIYNILRILSFNINKYLLIKNLSIMSNGKLISFLEKVVDSTLTLDQQGVILHHEWELSGGDNSGCSNSGCPSKNEGCSNASTRCLEGDNKGCSNTCNKDPEIPNNCVISNMCPNTRC